MSIYRVEGGVHKKINTLYDVQNAVNKKIQKGYYVLGGVHKKIYELSTGPVVTYSGTYSLSDVTVDSVDYTLLTCTKSGTLTTTVPLQYWMCGGGGKGGASGLKESSVQTSVGTVYDDFAGGGAAGGYVSEGTIIAGSHVITVGAASGVSKINDLTAKQGSAGADGAGGKGGSGGGAARKRYWESLTSQKYSAIAGTGNGVSTYPFGLSSLGAHCAAGGGGAYGYYIATNSYSGGNGGANGGSGGSISSSKNTGGSGGTKGGGKGGSLPSNAPQAGSAATFYGSGGGGASFYASGNSGASGGSGYQGVVYFLIPKDAQFIAA